MQDTEDDYMSDKFLCGSEQNDIRPGLVHNRSSQREFEMYKKRKVQEAEPKPKERANILLLKGLCTAIPSDNKGFKLLEKMGFKQGQSLGKSNTGIKEPIPIETKNDKAGLGKRSLEETSIHRRTNKKIEDEAKLAEKLRSFHSGNCEKRINKQVRSDFYKGQRACEVLDEQAMVHEPVQSFFWTEQLMKARKLILEEESDDESEKMKEDFATVENLNTLVMYLRNSYFYCIYCGDKGQDLSDLETFCPGPLREDHADLI